MAFKQGSKTKKPWSLSMQNENKAELVCGIRTFKFSKENGYWNIIEVLRTCFKKLITMYQKKSWTDQEDNLIRSAVKEMGDRPRWKNIAQSVNQLIMNLDPLNKRTPKQCRERWHNKLDPQILDKQWDQDQINKLFNLHNEHGNKWSLIATMMNGRTDNCVKNKFYSALRKGMRKINKYIVNLKRKLLPNKNVCIKEFKDVVLTKLIAVADKKYNDKLDIKQTSRTKTQRLSQAIKLALVKVSKNQDDYLGHVQNGIADDTYDIEEDLFKNIQQFCRNCKRKKGKRRSDEDADQNDQASQMIQESEENHQKQGKNQRKIKVQSVQKFPVILPYHQAKNKIIRDIIFEDENLNQYNGQSTNEDFGQRPKFSKNDFPDFGVLTNFTKVSNQQSREENKQKGEFKVRKMPSRQNDTMPAFFNDIVYQAPGFSFFQNIRSIEFERTDQNGKLEKDFKPQEIFKQISSVNPLEGSQNQLSLSSSNQFSSMIQKSQSFLNLYRSMEGVYDPNQVMYNSSSLSSGSNKQPQKFIEFYQKGQKKDDIQASSQVFAQSFNFTESLQLDDLFKRMAQNKN